MIVHLMTIGVANSPHIFLPNLIIPYNRVLIAAEDINVRYLYLIIVPQNEEPFIVLVPGVDVSRIKMLSAAKGVVCEALESRPFLKKRRCNKRLSCFSLDNYNYFRMSPSATQAVAATKGRCTSTSAPSIISRYHGNPCGNIATYPDCTRSASYSPSFAKSADSFKTVKSKCGQREAMVSAVCG